MAKNEKKQYISDNAQLMAEWDWENNDKLGLNPDDISVGSTIKIWWKCKDCDNCWQTTAGHRCDAKKPTGCPKCSAKKRFTIL